MGGKDGEAGRCCSTRNRLGTLMGWFARERGGFETLMGWFARERGGFGIIFEFRLRRRLLST